MAAFFRGLLLFLFGAIVGAGGILFFTPSFNVVVSRNAGSLKPVEFAPAAAPATAVAKAPEPAAPAAPAAPGAPAKPVVVAEAKPAPASPASMPALDFKAISEHLILWPASVTVTKAATVSVLVDGKKSQELALEAGTVLQVSKVQADGSLEARAKGAKFEIQSALTDFEAELGKRVTELVSKGTKFDSPYPLANAPSAPATMVPAPAAPAAPAVVAAAPKGPLTLAQRVDILFGNKPEAVAPVAPVAAPASPAPVVEAAPAADPKAAEKGKDLDRKLNQLFK